MHKKASSLAAALEKADRDVPKLDVGFDDESTRPVPLSLIRMFSQELAGEGDVTVSLKIGVPKDNTDAGIQIDTGDSDTDNQKKSDSD